MRGLVIGLTLLTAILSGSCRTDGGKESPGGRSGNANVSPVPSSPAAVRKGYPKIVAFGDSLTAGYGLPAEASYPSLLQSKIDAGGYHYEVVNAGISGDTSAGGLRRIDWTLDVNVKIVILELGANDILRGQPMQATKDNLHKIIDHVRSNGAQVLLAGMEAPTNSGPVYQKQVHETFQDLARAQGVALIPFFLQDVAGIESLNQNDGIHPNVEGTKIVAETVYRSLAPLLNERSRRPTN